MADKDDVIEGKLPLIRNPILRTTRSPRGTFDATQADGQPNLESFGYRDEIYDSDEEIPEFAKYGEATSVEVFYDLFFAANLCVFAEVQDVTNGDQLATFVCYFCLLWFTWLALGLFDVRFVTDSIFERCVRAVHFGAMVGFAVIAPSFKLNQQDPRTFRTMSLILATSRVALASQYGSILWHVRKFKSSRVALSLMCALNLVAAVIYLGVAFAFRETGTEALWVLWFVLTATEVAITVWGSLRWEVLSFYGTHLTNRVSLLTFILMGEGIVTVCSAVAKIVLNANQWTSPTIGNVTAGVANIYLVYMIYMDWRRAKRFPRWKQLIWSFLHLPFHLALKLFILASSQFVIWWKVIEVNFWMADQVEAALMGSLETITASDNPSDWFADTIRGAVDSVFETFVPQYFNTMMTVNETLDALKGIPIEFWLIDDHENPSSAAEAELIGFFNSQVETLGLAIENSLLANFKIDGYQSVSGSVDSLAQVEEQASDANKQKFYTVVIAAYAGAGFTLMLLNVLFIISRSRKWTPFNYVRKGINFLVGIGLCLVPLITTNPATMETFTFTPWPLPTIVLTFFVILVINHLPHPPPIFFEGKVKPQEEEKAGSGSPSLAGTGVQGAHEQKSGYQDVSIHDQDTDTSYQGQGNGQQR